MEKDTDKHNKFIAKIASIFAEIAKTSNIKFDIIINGQCILLSAEQKTIGVYAESKRLKTIDQDNYCEYYSIGSIDEIKRVCHILISKYFE